MQLSFSIRHWQP